MTPTNTAVTPGRVAGGDVVYRTNAPKPSQDIDTMICWMTNASLRPRQKLAIKQTIRNGRALVKKST